ncbi:MAG TPA: hypothetical protein VM345_04940 [Acidimicrobiales bacterium]|jgi:hypothetical protein|nr:hypothetical protein [Acidimicrobiales bacterium]
MSPDRSGKGRLEPDDPAVLAAIVAAVEAAWPRPVVVHDAPPAGSPWRFSNRWWMPRRAPAASRNRP